MGDIHYHHVKKLGFERVDYTDNVVYRKCGQHPFHMSIDLPGRLVIYWYAESYSCEMLRVDKNQNILGKKVISDIAELCDLLHLFGFEKQVTEFGMYIKDSKTPVYA